MIHDFFSILIPRNTHVPDSRSQTLAVLLSIDAHKQKEFVSRIFCKNRTYVEIKSLNLIRADRDNKSFIWQPIWFPESYQFIWLFWYTGKSEVRKWIIGRNSQWDNWWRLPPMGKVDLFSIFAVVLQFVYSCQRSVNRLAFNILH